MTSLKTNRAHPELVEGFMSALPMQTNDRNCA